MSEEHLKSAEQALFREDLDQNAGEGIRRKDFDFYEIRKCQLSLPHTKRLNHFTVLHVDRGSGNFNLALDAYEIKAGTIYFAYPGQLLSKLSLEGVTGYLMFGSEDFMLKANPQFLEMKLFQLYGLSHEIRLTGEEHHKLSSLAGSIGEEVKSRDHYRKEEIIQNLVNLHIYYTDRYVYHQFYEMEKEMHPKVRGFFALMNIKQNVNLKVADYASELNIAPNYLNQLIKDQTGKSVKTLIKDKTIRQACVYLIHTDFDIKEIAYLLDYNYPQYFIRDFKNAMGMTPLQYRTSKR